MESTAYTNISPTTLDKVLENSNFSDQSKEILRLVMLEKASVIQLAREYEMTRANIYKLVKRAQGLLDDVLTPSDSVWAKITIEVPVRIAKDLQSWSDDLKAVPENKHERYISSLSLALLENRTQMIKRK
jgi:transposase-like protein